MENSIAKITFLKRSTFFVEVQPPFQQLYYLHIISFSYHSLTILCNYQSDGDHTTDFDFGFVVVEDLLNVQLELFQLLYFYSIAL